MELKKILKRRRYEAIVVFLFLSLIILAFVVRDSIVDFLRSHMPNSRYAILHLRENPCKLAVGVDEQGSDENGV